jgi:hypothetical protein
MQRAFDIFDGDICWETVREREEIDFEQAPFVRQPSSWLDQVAHSLGFRRTRLSDRTG